MGRQRRGPATLKAAIWLAESTGTLDEDILAHAKTILAESGGEMKLEEICVRLYKICPPAGDVLRQAGASHWFKAHGFKLEKIETRPFRSNGEYLVSFD